MPSGPSTHRVSHSPQRNNLMSWPSEPCAHCPRAARGLALPCRAQASRHAAFCGLVDPDGPAYRPDYVALLCDEVTVPQEKEIIPASDSPPSRRDLDLSHFLRIHAKLCLYHENSSSCGCGVSICHAGYGTGLIKIYVSIDDCIRCSSRQLGISGT